MSQTASAKKGKIFYFSRKVENKKSLKKNVHFVWRKIELKILSVEKRWQISEIDD